MSVADERLGGLRLMALRDAIVASIAALWPNGPVAVKKHRGEWTHKTIERYAAQTPCIVVAYTGAKGWESTGAGKSQGDIIIAAFCITQDVVDGDEDDASLALTQCLLTLVPGNDFGVDGVSVAERVSGINSYTHEFDDKGVNIHEVSWEHQVELEKLSAADLAALPDFLRLFTTLPIGGEDDPDAEHMNDVRDP